MAWALVILAGLFETCFALSLKASNNFTRLVPSVLFVVFAAIGWTLLSTALRSLPVGSAYAVWTGIGAAGTAVAGMVFLGESTEVLKLVSASGATPAGPSGGTFSSRPRPTSFWSRG